MLQLEHGRDISHWIFSMELEEYPDNGSVDVVGVQTVAIEQSPIYHQQHRAMWVYTVMRKGYIQLRLILTQAVSS